MKFEGIYTNGQEWSGILFNLNNKVYELKQGEWYIKYYCNDILEMEGEF